MENQVMAAEPVTVEVMNAELTERFDANRLSQEDMARITEIADEIDVEDSQYVLQYGVAIQSQISQFADNVLNQVRAKDSGFVGEILTNLMLDVQKLDVDSLSNEGSFLSKIPFLGDMVDDSKKFIARYQTLSGEIERIINELEKARMNMLKDINLLDDLYDKNLDYLKELNYFIAAAEMKINDLHSSTIPEMKSKAEATGDPVDVQRLNDIVERTNRFEKKVHDLKLSKMITIQTAPQIRLIQNNDQVLVEKIQSSILNTIPLWKNQIVLSITMLRQKKALEVQKEVTDTTNDLLARNAEMLKDNTIGAAKEMERGIVDIDTLKKVNTDLITTIVETIRIQKEGREKRMSSERELVSLENELRDKLIELRTDK